MSTIRLIGDPPGPGEAKLRIKTGPHGEPHCFAVTASGEELELLGIVYVSVLLEPGEAPSAHVRAIEVEVDATVAAGSVEKTGG